MAHPNKHIREDGLKRLEVLARHCRAIGSDLITLCTGTRNTTDIWAFHPENYSSAAWRDMVHTMEQAILIAEYHDLRLGIEPELANVVSDVYKAHQLLTEINSDRLKIILDPANLFEKSDLPKVYALIDTAVEYLAKDIVMLHAKDRTSAGNFTAPGKGIIPFDYFLKQFRLTNVNAPVVAHGFPEEEVQDVVKWWKTLDLLD
jgi:sugar phosphate isomerase/epimerase